MNNMNNFIKAIKAMTKRKDFYPASESKIEKEDSLEIHIYSVKADGTKEEIMN